MRLFFLDEGIHRLALYYMNDNDEIDKIMRVQIAQALDGVQCSHVMQAVQSRLDKLN